jgi:hypothetical protein
MVHSNVHPAVARLGPQHPDTALLQHWQRINRDLEQFQI